METCLNDLKLNGGESMAEVIPSVSFTFYPELSKAYHGYDRLYRRRMSEIRKCQTAPPQTNTCCVIHDQLCSSF